VGAQLAVGDMDEIAPAEQVTETFEVRPVDRVVDPVPAGVPALGPLSDGTANRGRPDPFFLEFLPPRKRCFPKPFLS